MLPLGQCTGIGYSRKAFSLVAWDPRIWYLCRDHSVI